MTSKGSFQGATAKASQARPPFPNRAQLPLTTAVGDTRTHAVAIFIQSTPSRSLPGGFPPYPAAFSEMITTKFSSNQVEETKRSAINEENATVVEFLSLNP
jgi:hypothetical protein